MSRRSQKIRAQRREKHARRWAGHEKAHRGALHDGLANELEIGVSSNRLGNPGRYPEQRTD